MKLLKVLGRFYTEIHSLYLTKLIKSRVYTYMLLPDVNMHMPGVVFLGHTLSDLQVPEFVFLMILINFMKYASRGRRLTCDLQLQFITQNVQWRL